MYADDSDRQALAVRRSSSAARLASPPTLEDLGLEEWDPFRGLADDGPTLVHASCLHCRQRVVVDGDRLRCVTPTELAIFNDDEIFEELLREPETTARQWFAVGEGLHDCYRSGAEELAGARASWERVNPDWPLPETPPHVPRLVLVDHPVEPGRLVIARLSDGRLVVPELP